MAMERLSEILRQQGNERDKRIADDIDRIRRQRGRDISMEEFSRKPEVDLKQIREAKPVALSIRERITSGEFRVGTKLDPRVLARQYETNTSRIAIALNILRDEGLVERRQKRGTIVLGGNPQV